MKEEAIKALKQFGREDLIDSPYGYDIDDNIEIFMTIRQMIKYNNLQSQLKAKEEVIKEAISHIRDCCNMDSKWVNLHFDYAQNEMSSEQVDDLLEILSKGENK